MKKNLAAKIKKYFAECSPLGKKTKLKSLKFLGGGNHFNFLAKTSKGDFVLRVAKPEALGAGVLFDIPDEFMLLKLIEKYEVAPKAIAIDLENFEFPMLIEKFVSGKKYSSYKKISEKQIKEAMKLMTKISRINLSPKNFPFRFSYQNYETSVRGWKWRLNEIKKLGRGKKSLNQIVKKFDPIINQAAKILLKNKKLLAATKPSFIYNDAHGGNTLWLGKKAIFIDWQKVSLGDPSFMPAVFALAIEKKSPMPKNEFFRWFAGEYNKSVKIKNFEKLFKLRILEREVANMLWVVWEALKLGNKPPHPKFTDRLQSLRVSGL
ncbi:MAG: phosphotransferase [bacterium]|nr:phosphotransferase [bacterium]